MRNSVMEREPELGGRSYMIGQTAIAARPLEPALHLVSTPIGNLGDITLRALETLAGADILACEDTRVTRTLLARYGIGRRPMTYHEHNEDVAGPRLIEAIQSGRSVALVSDAGTPLVSDPGYRLALLAIDAGVKVVPVPGPSALLAALTGSGLPTDTFLFAGFLPTKAGPRRQRLVELRDVPATLVFFESPRRLADSLAAMAETLGPRPAAIGRELTKAFEEFRRGTLDQLAEHYGREDTPRGEVVVSVGPPPPRQMRTEDTDSLLLSLAAVMPAARAAQEAARLTGVAKGPLYRRLIALKDGGDG